MTLGRSLFSHIESLCENVRNLRDMGVPQSKIGLVHSYPCDPDKQKAGIDGYASEPSLSGNPEVSMKRGKDKQFLLL